ncbi:unnamed protein product [Acanthoscelides obtectus]|uniref:Uncharacterized protein n=1 Tax=Acanthoscelides obtectus TaxID=200917 RepID=A0A9P0LUT2_ACAOB|nr:unnamed protein product [Acanthoscelides obtectus]CAK1682305.1 hypothetical protein AOBTE_LOCUS33550 [Acanthoscelides obtectus]
MLSLIIIPVLYLKYGVCDQLDSSQLDPNPIDVHHVIKKAVHDLSDREKDERKAKDYSYSQMIPIDVLDNDHVIKKKVIYQLGGSSSSQVNKKSTSKLFENDDPDLQPIYTRNSERRKKPYYSTDASTTDATSPYGKKLFNRKTYTDLDNQFESNEEDQVHLDIGGSQNPSLGEFLNNYAQKIKQEKYGNKDDYSDDIKAGKGKKSWSLLNSKRHNHPYDDRKGWISLEPIPWSVSKVSKWQSMYKPTEKPAWHSRPWLDYPETVQDGGYKYEYPTTNSLIDKRKYQVYPVQNNEQGPEPMYQKPSYGHPPHPHNSYNEDYLQEADCDHRHYNRPSHTYNSLKPHHYASDRDAKYLTDRPSSPKGSKIR